MKPPVQPELIPAGEIETVECRGHELDRLTATLAAQGKRIITMSVWCQSGWRCVVAKMPAPPAATVSHGMAHPHANAAGRAGLPQGVDTRPEANKRKGERTVTQGEGTVNTAAKKRRVLPVDSYKTGDHARRGPAEIDPKTRFRLPPGKICLVH